MKKLVVVMAVAVLSMSYGAARAAAQGPQGAGAGSAASSSSGITHSLNPIKWVKKDSKSADQQLDAKDDQDKRLTATLQSQGVLSANTDAKSACENFKALDECVAALHASKNLGLDFNCLKSNLTGVQTGADMSSCRGGAGDKAISLNKAIHAMKPDADAKAEAKNAEKQAKDDLKASKA
jgi:ABC-type transporter Mla subunit MlaD